jgi:hypothetical protein
MSILAYTSRNPKSPSRICIGRIDKKEGESLERGNKKIKKKCWHICTLLHKKSSRYSPGHVDTEKEMSDPWVFDNEADYPHRWTRGVRFVPLYDR